MLIKSKQKFDLRDRATVKRLLADAYLGIHVDPTTIFNPLRTIPDQFSETPYLYVQWLMSQPEYFQFIVKEIMNIELHPFQCVILKEMWNRKLPFLIGSRGMSKTFLLSLYTMLRLLLLPGRKVVVCGAAFRQSKIVFDYMRTFYNNAPILADIIDSFGSESKPSRDVDMCTFRIGESIATMLPIGNGEKIRGQRAHDILADEINSINQEVLEKVIFGFASVSATPMVNVKDRAAMDVAKIIGYNLASKSDDYHKSNQIIMSGTCGYTFQHMYTYWKKWHNIIMSKGDPDRINEIFQGEIPLGFDWRDYSIMRIPFELLPRGFMDEGIVAQAQSAIGSSQFNMEYKAVFAGDSAGFYKRTLIESCVANHMNNINHKSEQSIIYHPVLKGLFDKKYIFGIDPASEQDKFAITVLEQHAEHRRIVYVWTSNKKDFQTDRADGFITNTNDFYTYCIFKIRDLMRRFPCERIIIDSQGGGHMIVEGLKSNELLKDGEVPLLPVIVPGKPSITDGEPGLHIIELASFSDNTWISNANHGLKKDLENKVLLFPFVDAVSLEIAGIQDNSNNRLIDSQEDNVFEIEELKNELSSIVHMSTPTGKERWDTPDTKLPGNKQKGRMRKDRYSSLLIANMCARTIANTPVYIINQESGGFAGASNQTKGLKYTGSSWLANKLNDLYQD
jgi:hypothetical protein